MLLSPLRPQESDLNLGELDRLSRSERGNFFLEAGDWVGLFFAVVRGEESRNEPFCRCNDASLPSRIVFVSAEVALFLDSGSESELELVESEEEEEDVEETEPEAEESVESGLRIESDMLLE